MAVANVPLKRCKVRPEDRAHAGKLRQHLLVNTPYSVPASEAKSRKGDIDSCCAGFSGCTGLSAWGVQARALLITHVMTKDEGERREFLSRRITQRTVAPNVEYEDGDQESPHKGRRINSYVIESNTALLAHGPRHAPEDPQPVCVRAFKYLLGISGNKIYQPAVPSREFDLDVNGGNRLKDERKLLQVDAITAWLKDLASFFQHDPKDECVSLPFATKKVVYQLYKAEYNACPEQDRSASPYFKAGLCGSSHFRKTWRRTKDLKRGIRLRKWLKFALCDECVDFRERRSKAPTKEMKEKILQGRWVAGWEGVWWCVAVWFVML
jgi:hypothetical protein